ncbi:hypothetical protein SELMODRAFT_135734, partial [Selaginella moellendorffii]
QSTYCYHLQQHCNTIGRNLDVINLEPAAEDFKYAVAADIRELVPLEDVMEEFNYGPNGGLIYCIYLEENMDDWLAEKLEDYIDDDVVFDCPGQIELYTHIPVFKSLVEQLKRWDFNLCAVYLLDSQFVSDVTKYISGCLSSLSAMVQLELPHVNVLTKMDLVAKKRDIEDYLDPDPVFLLSEMNANTAPRYGKLNAALAELIDDYRMVNFVTSGRHKRSQVRHFFTCGNCV